MSRKPKKGYFVRGQFVAEGSELDLELKAELKGTDEASKTDLKRESTELQKLGEALLTLRADLMEGLALPDKLADAVAEARRITNFEGKRRQMQFIGKLMRGLDEETLQSVRDALEEQQQRLGPRRAGPAPGREVARRPDRQGRRAGAVAAGRIPRPTRSSCAP